MPAGSNFNAFIDDFISISETDESQKATFAECIGNPNIVAITPDIFTNGCFIRRTDLASGVADYVNTGSLLAPVWAPITGGGGSGTVTSVGLTVPGGFSVAGSPITTSGTFAVTTALNGVIFGDGGGNFLAIPDGTSGQQLTTDGAGGYSWATSSGGTAIGGTVTGGTDGSVLFINPAGILAEDNANFYYDNTNNRWGFGTNTPSRQLTINGLGLLTDQVTRWEFAGNPVTTIINDGTQNWFLDSVGRISYSTPGAQPGITFFTTTSLERSDIKKRAGGGFTFAAHALGTLPPDLVTITAAGDVGIGTTAPTATLDVRGNFYVDDIVGGSHINSYIGDAVTQAIQAPSVEDGLNVARVFTTDTASNRTIWAMGEYGGTGGALNAAQGLNAFAMTNPSATGALTRTIMGGALRAGRYITFNLGANAVSQLSAVSALVSSAGALVANSIVDSATFHAEAPQIHATGTVTNHSGLWVRGAAISGALTNHYGLQVDTLTSGTNRWGVYVATDTSFFGGDVGIGTSTPAYRLEVESDPASILTDDITQWTNGATGNPITRIRNNGSQQWFLRDGAGVLVGRITYSTPTAQPGIVFFDEFDLERVDIKHSEYVGGGLDFATHSLGTIPPIRMRIEPAAGFVLLDTSISIGDVATERLDVVGNITTRAQGEMKWQDAAGGEFVSFRAPAVVTSSQVYDLPPADGTAGQQLTTNGAGVLSWASSGSGGSVNKYYTQIALPIGTTTITHSLGLATPKAITKYFEDDATGVEFTATLSTYTANSVDVTVVGAVTLANITIMG